MRIPPPFSLFHEHSLPIYDFYFSQRVPTGKESPRVFPPAPRLIAYGSRPNFSHSRFTSPSKSCSSSFCLCSVVFPYFFPRFTFHPSEVTVALYFLQDIAVALSPPAIPPLFLLLPPPLTQSRLLFSFFSPRRVDPTVPSPCRRFFNLSVPLTKVRLLFPFSVMPRWSPFPFFLLFPCLHASPSSPNFFFLTSRICPQQVLTLFFSLLLLDRAWPSKLCSYICI